LAAVVVGFVADVRELWIWLQLWLVVVVVVAVVLVVVVLESFGLYY
jgi:hypothetical protein